MAVVKENTKKETKPMNLFAKLLEVRKAVPYLKKEGKQGQGINYNYNSSSQVIGAVRSKLDEMGVLLISDIVGEPKVNAREKENNKGGISIVYEVEISVKFTWVNVENPEETISINWFTMGLDTGDNSKSVGKALTYAEKYFMLKQFNIATDNDDPDTFQQKTDNNVKEVPDQSDFLLVTDKAKEYTHLRGNGTYEQVLQALGIKESDLSKLTMQQIKAHLKTLDNWIHSARVKKERETEQAKQEVAAGE